MGCELHWVKCNPQKPSKKVSPKNPTWEVQIRTTDKEKRKIWTDMSIKSKAIRAVKDDEESPILYYQANLKKKSLKEDGSSSMPVVVEDGKGREIDPDTVGNGSMGNVMVYQQPYSFKSEEGKLMEGISTTLKKIQVTKLMIYVAKPQEEFEETDTEIIEPTPETNKTAHEDDEF
jgi:hypothetical protein